MGKARFQIPATAPPTPPSQELAEASCLLDFSDHRFDNLLPQLLPASPTRLFEVLPRGRGEGPVLRSLTSGMFHATDGDVGERLVRPKQPIGRRLSRCIGCVIVALRTAGCAGLGCKLGISLPLRAPDLQT